MQFYHIQIYIYACFIIHLYNNTYSLLLENSTTLVSKHCVIICVLLLNSFERNFLCFATLPCMSNFIHLSISSHFLQRYLAHIISCLISSFVWLHLHFKHEFQYVITYNLKDICYQLPLQHLVNKSINVCWQNKCHKYMHFYVFLICINEIYLYLRKKCEWKSLIEENIFPSTVKSYHAAALLMLALARRHF